MLAIPLILAAVFGLALVELAHPRRVATDTALRAHSRWPALFELTLRLSLGFGLGLSVQSTLAYISLLAAGSLVPGLIAESLLALAAGVFLWARGRGKARLLEVASLENASSQLESPGQPLLPPDNPEFRQTTAVPAWIDRLFTVSLVVAVGVLAVLPVLRWYQAPHGYWDAWQMWTPKAVILHRGGAEWAERISTFNSHPGYPLLVPLTTARFWTWVNASFHLGAVFANSYAYMLCMAGVLISVTGMLRGKQAAVFAAAALCAAPALPAWTAALYADVQVSFHVMATAALLAWTWTTNRNAAGLLSLVGVALGGVLWSKNEGMMLSLAAAPAIMVVSVARLGSKQAAIALAGIGLSATPFVLCLGHFKLCHAPQGDLIASLVSADIGATLFATDRWMEVLNHGWRIAKQERLPLAAALLAMFALWRRPVLTERMGLVLASFPVLAILGYLYVYLRTPHDLTWHLATSMSRLFLHIFPAGIFVVLFFCREPRREGPSSHGVTGTDHRGEAALPGFPRIAWSAALAILALVPPGYQAWQRNQSKEPPRWSQMHKSIANSRVETLRRFISESDRISIDPLAEQAMGSHFALIVAQYRLAPCRVAVGGDAPWVIAFHKTADEPRQFATEQALTPIRDLQNGLRLYHRGPIESDTAGNTGRNLR
jgi:hypothetical protein